MIPCAARATSSPSVDASSPTAASAASRESRTPPASTPSAGRWPSTTCASVTVGSLPPRPYAAGPGCAPAERGPDAQRAAGVAPGDRAAARADGLDVEARQRQRASRDRPLVGLAHDAGVDHADVAGGAAHVEAEHVGRSRTLREQARALGAARRSGEDRERGVRARRGRGSRGRPRTASPRARAARRPRSELRGSRGARAAAARAPRRSPCSRRARTRAATR